MTVSWPCLEDLKGSGGWSDFNSVTVSVLADLSRVSCFQRGGTRGSLGFLANISKLAQVGSLSARLRDFPGGTSSKESACQCRRGKRSAFDPWVGKIPWRRAWQPTPVFLPGESLGQRSLAGQLQSTGLHRVGLDWSDLAQMQARCKIEVSWFPSPA